MRTAITCVMTSSCEMTSSVVVDLVDVAETRRAAERDDVVTISSRLDAAETHQWSIPGREQRGRAVTRSLMGFGGGGWKQLNTTRFLRLCARMRRPLRETTLLSHRLHHNITSAYQILWSIGFVPNTTYRLLRRSSSRRYEHISCSHAFHWNYTITNTCSQLSPPLVHCKWTWPYALPTPRRQGTLPYGLTLVVHIAAVTPL